MSDVSGDIKKILDGSDVGSGKNDFLGKQVRFILSATKTNLDIIDSAFNIRYVDEAWRKFYGDPEGKKCYEYFMDRNEPCQGCGVMESMASKKTVIAEEVLAKENNRVVQVTTIPFQSESGEWLFAEVNVDISKRKEMEEEIKHMNVFLDSIIENMPSMVFLKKADDLSFVKFNRAGEELLGYEREELLGKTDHDFFPKEQADFFEERDRETLSGDREVDISREPIDTKYKGRRILHTKKVPIRNENGEAVFLMGVSEDITEKVSFEEEKNKQELKLKLFRDLMDQSSDSLFLVNGDTGNFIDVNEQTIFSLGYSREELLNMGVMDVETAVSSEEELRTFITELKVSGSMVFRGEHRKKGGEVFPVEVNLKYVEMEKACYIIAVARDITERMEFEKQLKSSEEKYRTIFSNTGTVMAIVDTDRYIKMANGEFRKFFGFDPGTSDPPRRIDEIVHEEDLDEVKNYHRLRRIDPASAPSSYGVKMKDSSGHMRETHVTVAMIPGTEMSVFSFLDLTDIKKKELELEKQRDLLDSTNKALEHKVAELNDALGHIKRLEGLVPICSSCKKIMKTGSDPKKTDSWVNIEKYISDRTEASFTHGICPDCIGKLYGDYVLKRKKERNDVRKRICGRTVE
jgi:PAS domain S-box-containing protein